MRARQCFGLAVHLDVVRLTATILMLMTEMMTISYYVCSRKRQ